MQDGTIGRRYARALASALGKAGLQDFQQIEGELVALKGLLEKKTGNTDFRQAMLNPSFSLAQRRSILEATARAHGFHEMTQKLLALLVDKQRIRNLPAIAAAFQAEVDERTGRVRAHITSARILEGAAVKQIVAALEKKTGKKVVPELEVEPEVLGGVAARIGGQVFDNTIRTQLDRMKTALGAGAA